MPEALTIDFAKPVPLFPLPSCALLPHATVPLHVFEQRYRQMTREALDSRGLIAMAVFEGDTWREQYDQTPPIREHVCVGHIVHHQQLQDGRYNLLLQGVCRARVVRELEHEHYRLAVLEPIETDAVMEIDLDDRRHRIESLLKRRRLKQLAAVGAIKQWLTREVPTVAMIDLMVLTLCQDSEQRYAMLAEPDVERRADWLEHHLQQTDELLALAERFGPGVSDEGVPLN